mgnify:CR=1 FL=1
MIDKEGLFMFRKRRAPSMEELQALEEMDQKSKPIRRNELIDESEQQPSQIEEEETEETEQEEKKKDRKAGKLLRLFGGSIYETVKRWYVGSVNESIMVNVTKDDLLEIFQKNTSSVSDTDVAQTGAKPQANTLAVTYGKNQEGPVTLSVLLKSPVANGTISSSFGERDGKFHQGLDIAADTDTPITASLTGTVKEAGENDSYGKYVLLDHGSGIETRYAHCNSISVKQGDHVNMGDEIAKVGSTGDSSGPHVHLELLIDGTPYNPQTVLQK